MCEEFCRIDYSVSALLPPTLPLSPMSGWLSVDNRITAYYLPNPRAWVTAYCRAFFRKMKLLADFIPDFLSMLYNFLPSHNLMSTFILLSFLYFIFSFIFPSLSPNCFPCFFLLLLPIFYHWSNFFYSSSFTHLEPARNRLISQKPANGNSPPVKKDYSFFHTSSCEIYQRPYM